MLPAVYGCVLHKTEFLIKYKLSHLVTWNKNILTNLKMLHDGWRIILTNGGLGDVDNLFFKMPRLGNFELPCSYFNLSLTLNHKMLNGFKILQT